MKRDMHVHTTFSDGKATPEDMIKHALELGMDCIGFSDHSHSPQTGGERWTMPLARKDAYLREIARLKAEYADRISVLCGIEQDLYSDASPDGYDYIIVAMHFIRMPGDGERFVPVDMSPDTLRRGAEEGFGGDIYALCEAYYEQLSTIPEKLPNCDIIAHFDLITLFLEQEPSLFDTNNLRYVAAWQKAVDRLLSLDIPFEINTGAVSRGYRTTPYPAAEIRDYIRERGGRFVLSSDSHCPENLRFGFDELQNEAEG